jgi:hypothetical protein
MKEQMDTLHLSEGCELRNMSIAVLTDQCMIEINYYTAGVLLSETYYRELLFRALLHGDHDAWNAVQRCLKVPLRGWMVCHPKIEAACRLDNVENYITQAIARFHKAAILKQVDYWRLPSALEYLRVSLNSVLLDALRDATRPFTALSDKRETCNSFMSTPVSDFWEMLEKMSLDTHKQRMAFLLFNCGLRPHEIVQLFPEEFCDEQEISQLRCSIIKQLMIGWNNTSSQ